MQYNVWTIDKGPRTEGDRRRNWISVLDSLQIHNCEYANNGALDLLLFSFIFCQTDELMGLKPHRSWNRLLSQVPKNSYMYTSFYYTWKVLRYKAHKKRYIIVVIRKLCKVITVCADVIEFPFLIINFWCTLFKILFFCKWTTLMVKRITCIH